MAEDCVEMFRLCAAQLFSQYEKGRPALDLLGDALGGFIFSPALNVEIPKSLSGEGSHKPLSQLTSAPVFLNYPLDTLSPHSAIPTVIAGPCEGIPVDLLSSTAEVLIVPKRMGTLGLKLTDQFV